MIERLTTADRVTLRLAVPMRTLTVWQALTGPAHIARWWGGQVRLQPRLGGRFLERRSDHESDEGHQVLTTGSIIAWEPPAGLAMSWSEDDWSAATEVRIALKDTEAGCLLTLDHLGWQRIDDARRADLIEAHAEGWARHLDALARYLSGN